MLAAGGAADDDGSRQADLKGSASTGMPAFLDREKKIWNPWTGEPSPNRMPRQNDVHVNAVADILLFVDIQLWFPPADMVNVDVRRNIPIGLFCWTVGWWEVLVAWGEPHGQP